MSEENGGNGNGTPPEEALPPWTPEDSEERDEAIRIAQEEAEQARLAEVERVDQEVAEHNQEASRPVDFWEFVEAIGLDFPPPEPSDDRQPSVHAPDSEMEPLPLPEEQETEPPEFQPVVPPHVIDYPGVDE